MDLYRIIKYFDILNRLGMTHKCDGRTDFTIANAALHYFVWTDCLETGMRADLLWSNCMGVLLHDVLTGVHAQLMNKQHNANKKHVKHYVLLATSD